MASVLTMPKLSDTMEEGAIAGWLKKEGEFVEEGELLAEIETDKATMEYEAPEEGVLFKIIVPEGGKADVGAPLAIFADKGESPNVEDLLAGAGNAAPAASAPAAEDKNEGVAPAAVESTPVVATPPSGGRTKSSPLARKMAKDKGIDIAQISGTGPNGRVVARDVEGFKGGGTAPSSASVAVAASPAAGDHVEPVSMMRKTIAKRLLAAKNDAPHFYLTRSIDMTATIDWRKKVNASADPDAGIPKVSFNDIVMLAASKALRKHPGVNASWEGEQIRKFSQVNIAMAVALPTGLVTPVIHNTDRLGVREIAAMTKSYAAKARNGELSNNDFMGGTFTISNLGMAGIDEFTAIINPPQAAILAVGATKMKAVVDEASGDIVARPIMKVTMSCDHRVVDGWIGAQFLKDFVANLEDPLMMLA